jgi:hypothetical protein
MVIDFEKIAEAHLEGFKGGQGKLDTRNYVDDKEWLEKVAELFAAKAPSNLF